MTHSLSSSSRLQAIMQSVPGSQASRAREWRGSMLSDCICSPLDRIAELGDDRCGHRGCVNAISWAEHGQLLLTGSDDTTVRMWRAPTDLANSQPLVETAVIHTGHTSNIFAAHMLPYSTRIVTCARDATVRVSDVGSGLLAGTATHHQTSTANVRVFRCHSEATKRVLLEDSPDTFLTVAEDGRVRQHDLRARPHECRRSRSRYSQNDDLDSCGPPLVRLPHELHSISSSPLAPHEFVVGGDGDYGYLFDRRQSGRFLHEEWGVPVSVHNLTSCVRRFGRPNDGKTSRGQYITGVRMARSNRHEVILSHSRDAVYLYSTLDDPTDPASLRSRSSVLPSRAGPRVSSGGSTTVPSPSLVSATPVASLRDLSASSVPKIGTSLVSDTQGDVLTDPPPMSGVDHDRDTVDDDQVLAGALLDDNQDPSSALEHDDAPTVYSEDDGTVCLEDDDWIEDFEDEGMDQDQDASSETLYSSVPVVLPRSRYAGAVNVRTIKDVNFVGPNDDLIASGSDDGHLFLWNKLTCKLHGIYEADGAVVNVIEPHPSLPIIAVSGIDDTVKMFGPRRGRERSSFDRMPNAERIVSENEATSRRPVEVISREAMIQFLLNGMGSNTDEAEDDEGGNPACINQ